MQHWVRVAFGSVPPDFRLSQAQSANGDPPKGPGRQPSARVSPSQELCEAGSDVEAARALLTGCRLQLGQRPFISLPLPSC